MYLEHLHLQKLRSFVNQKFDLLHPDRRYPFAGIPAPRLKNVNLLLGSNGSGKSTVLKGAALSILGPAVRVASISSYKNVRLGRYLDTAKFQDQANIAGRLTLNSQDGFVGRLTSHVSILRQGDAEGIEYSKVPEPQWNPVFTADSNAFLCLGYGSTRRTESRKRFDAGARNQSNFVRAQRIMSIFDDSYSLVPLSVWLPTISAVDPRRFDEIVSLINAILPTDSYRFLGDFDAKENEYMFSLDDFMIPYPALSDGYRAFLGWAFDLLYHLHTTTPSPTALSSVRGVVMVDEVDLHLHPDWQRSIVSTIALAFPKLQFIFTTHSPLVIGGVEWMNILHLKKGPGLTTAIERLNIPVHGLDADQVLLTEFFGLESTRAPDRQIVMDTLRKNAQAGNQEASMEYMRLLSSGSEFER